MTWLPKGKASSDVRRWVRERLPRPVYGTDAYPQEIHTTLVDNGWLLASIPVVAIPEALSDLGIWDDLEPNNGLDRWDWVDALAKEDGQ